MLMILNHNDWHDNDEADDNLSLLNMRSNQQYLVFQTVDQKESWSRWTGIKEERIDNVQQGRKNRKCEF